MPQPNAGQPYIGRFAPSPTGPLHLGSLFTALISWLHAKSAGGQWLLRIEDIDETRCRSHSIDQIKRCLEAHHLLWDGPAEQQSLRHEYYAETIERLQAQDQVFWCSCSRKTLQESQGVCQSPACRSQTKPPHNQSAQYAIRLTAHEKRITFTDQLQGDQTIERVADGMALMRRDGLYAYNLVSVVDDTLQGVTHVVRGIDLLDGTFAHIAVQLALALPPPTYAHCAVLTTANGLKLSKQNHAAAVTIDNTADNIKQCLSFLDTHPPRELRDCRELLSWSLENWEAIVRQLSGLKAICLENNSQN